MMIQNNNEPTTEELTDHYPRMLCLHCANAYNWQSIEWANREAVLRFRCRVYEARIPQTNPPSCTYIRTRCSGFQEVGA